MHAPHPPVTHAHMPYFETARMKALQQKKLHILVQMEDIDSEIRRLVELEQRKVFAAFKASLATTPIEQHSLELDPEFHPDALTDPLTTRFDYLNEFTFIPKKESPK